MNCPQCQSHDLQQLTGSSLWRCRDCRWLSRIIDGKAVTAFDITKPKRRKRQHPKTTRRDGLLHWMDQ